jgi:hypothetical protein
MPAGAAVLLDVNDDKQYASYFSRPGSQGPYVMSFSVSVSFPNLDSHLEIWKWVGLTLTGNNIWQLARSDALLIPTPFDFTYDITHIVVVRTPAGQLAIAEQKGDPFKPGGKYVRYGSGNFRVQVWYNLKSS